MGVADTQSRAPVRLAVLDDHEVLLDSLTSWIGANAPDFDLVLCASTWPELVHSSPVGTAADGLRVVTIVKEGSDHA